MKDPKNVLKKSKKISGKMGTSLTNLLSQKTELEATIDKLTPIRCAKGLKKEIKYFKDSLS